MVQRRKGSSLCELTDYLFQPVVKFLAMWRAVLAALRWVGGHDIYEKDDNHTVVLMIIMGGMSITGLLIDHDIVFDKD